MGDNLYKYQAGEVLNKVLNDGSDALKVDIDNATISAGDLEVNTDALETKVDATNTKLDALLVLVTAIKATTDKLDACVNASNQLEVKSNT
tara:strand:+ start:1018 stop:1290 length:273 start_codon:yes stop_codon:yes gene_type:complete